MGCYSHYSQFFPIFRITSTDTNYSYDLFRSNFVTGSAIGTNERTVIAEPEPAPKSEVMEGPPAKSLLNLLAAESAASLHGY